MDRTSMTGSFMKREIWLNIPGSLRRTKIGCPGCRMEVFKRSPEVVKTRHGIMYDLC